jgi:hypothetical protein
MDVPKEMIYKGPNADLVNDVISFAFSDQILSGRGGDGDSPLIFPDIRHAMFAATEAEIPVAFTGHGVLTTWPPDNDYEWSVGITWFHLKDGLIAELIQTTEWYAWEKQHETAVQTCESLALGGAKTSTPFIDYLMTLVPELGPEDDIGYYRAFVVLQTAADMMECCKNRAFNGMTDNWWEKIFAVYRQGLFPCGWLGKFPIDGRMIAWRNVR